mgnify:CR=1 FL=1
MDSAFTLFRPSRLLPLMLLLLSVACITEDRRLSGLPVEQRTLFLQNFGNSTFEGDLQMELTESLRTYIHMRRGYVLVEDRDAARFILFGDVILYRREGHLFDNELNPTRYDLNMVVRVRLIERQTGLTVTSFEEDARTQYSTQEGLVEDEVTARRRLYSSICRKIYNRISQEYPQQSPSP